MKRTSILLLLTALFALPAVSVYSQTRFELKRTKHDSRPKMLQIFGGFNGISDPSEKLQDQFENTIFTDWGGILVGLQGLMVLDTIGLPFWAGVEFNYQRMAKRYLAQIPGVYYKSDSTKVEFDERVFALGGQALFMITVIDRVHIQLGGGVQYLFSMNDVESEVVGLFQSIWIPTLTGAINMKLLRYDHGSIDINFRAMKGLGEYGSFQFQSALGFTFDF